MSNPGVVRVRSVFIAGIIFNVLFYSQLSVGLTNEKC